MAYQLYPDAQLGVSAGGARKPHSGGTDEQPADGLECERCGPDNAAACDEGKWYLCEGERYIPVSGRNSNLLGSARPPSPRSGRG